MSKLIIKNTNILYENNRFITGNLLVNNKIISNIYYNSDFYKDNYATIINGENLFLLPGLIDIHTHGGNGIDIVNCTMEDLNELTKFYSSKGVTSFLATIGTVSKEKIIDSLEKIKNLIEKGSEGAQILGIHMEGPYIASDFRGAQNNDDIRSPSLKEFEEFFGIAGGNIKLITIAPELKNALKFIKAISKKGTVVSIGHSGADYETCQKAIRLGVNSITHFLNGMKSFHQHRPSIMGAALETDIYCEIICDGKHLHPGTIRMLLKAKGIDRLIMVTDSILAAGLGDGIYKGFIDIIVKNGDAQLVDGTRAGSTLTAIEALKNVIKFSGLGLEKAIKLITENPARLLGIDNQKGSIKEGKDADIVLLDKNLNIIYTISKGKIIFKGDIT